MKEDGIVLKLPDDLEIKSLTVIGGDSKELPFLKSFLANGQMNFTFFFKTLTGDWRELRISL